MKIFVEIAQPRRQGNRLNAGSSCALHESRLHGVSSYGALVVFGLWFGVVDFLLQPVTNYLSRRNEFAADQFAKLHSGGAAELGTALLKLRETSHAMPISHPVFSSVYYSHPPLIERLAALGYT